MLNHNVLCKVVFCVVIVTLSQAELIAQWDPTNTKGLVDWTAIYSSLSSGDMMSNFERVRNTKKKAMETLLAAEIPKEKLSNPLIAKLFKGKWDMFRNPGTTGFIGTPRDPNQKEFELVFGFGNNMVQKKTVIAVLDFGQEFKSFYNAEFFSVESIQVKKLKTPWTFESNTFPAGTEVITMSLSEISAQVWNISHTWNCTLVPYKNGWSGKLEDVYQRTPASTHNEYSTYNEYDMFSDLGQGSLNSSDERMMGYNQVHLVYLTPRIKKKDDQNKSESEDNTGVSNPEF